MVEATEETSSAPSEGEKLFALKVQPLFVGKCLVCHGEDPDELEGEFDLRSREAMLRGGAAFGDEVLVPGSAEKSLLYKMVQRLETDFEMPPKESEKLSEEETWSIRDWINAGAPWPDEARVADIYRDFAEGVVWKTSGGLGDDWTNRKYKEEDLWAYRPLWKDESGRLQGQQANPIDVLINDRLTEAKLRPAPPVDRRTLIRRATFDLLGLPPEPKDVERFVSDPREHAVVYAELIETLLASPHYGEQWGRHWLDVVRYADSSGFANDWERPNAWRYRDYVVRSFNSDKPYDQFVREQLAGDEILESRKAESRKRGDSAAGEPDSELLVAAGFLRMGPWEHTAMSVAKVTRQQFLDDITDSVGQVFLAHALQCCRCHDHKFDPIPTRDYYSIQAIFATTQFADVDAPWLPEENRSNMDEDRRYHKMRLDENQKVLETLGKTKKENERKWFEERDLPYKSISEAKKANASKNDIPQATDLMSPDDFGRNRVARKWQSRFPWEMDRYKPIAFSVFTGKTPGRGSGSRIMKPANPVGKGQPTQTFILGGGDVFSPTIKVDPGVLSAVPGAVDYQVPTGIAGRRTSLADWIVSEQNTLTSRVMVNRIWQFHFGRGIAGNPNNFGATGKKPTHPELLDWLARSFMENKWSIKQMHRQIMLSETYQRSSSFPQASNQLSPDELSEAKRLYAVFQPRRLAAEEIRDTMLAVTGELNPELGGISNRPDMNLEAALQPRMIMGTFAPSYVPNPRPEQRNRRSLYALKLRGQRDPFLETFNQPGSERSCEMRDTSTITPQSLTLLNSDETSDRALAFAARVLKETKKDEDAIRRVFELAYNRPPDEVEIADALNHWRQMHKIEEQIEYAPREMPTTIVRRAQEENTGEYFSFTERLFVYEDYVHDLQPHEVDARTRALSDVCLAILNSNEFVFLY